VRTTLQWMTLVLGMWVGLTGCTSNQTKEPDPDRAKQESDDLKKNLAKEHGGK